MNSYPSKSGLLRACLLMVPWIAGQAHAADAAGVAVDERIERIRELSLEDILNTEVTSVLGKSDTILSSPSAVYVLTADDLRRSGVRHLPDALRMVPGINVVQTDAWSWAVDARETAKRKYPRGLQVLVDGRSIYSPAWAGTFWDQADVLFEDLDRIEAIRGPGGATWGANAAKGVINIITKEAFDTLGFYGSTGGGNVDRVFGEFRYGAALGENGAMRVYGKARDVAESPAGGDGWNAVQGGARADWRWADDQHLQVQGDLSWGERGTWRVYPRFGAAPTNEVVLDRFEVAGVNALSKYTKQLGEESEISLQAYYDHVSRRGAAPDDLSQDKYDIQFRHRFPLPLGQDFQYGVGYQYFPSTVANRGDASTLFIPQTRRFQMLGLFVQDEVRFFEDRLRVIGGVRVEYFEPAGWNPIPNLRLAFEPVEGQVVWAAVSRGVTIADRSQLDILQLPTPGGPIYDPSIPGLPIFIRGQGAPDSGVESRIAYELGYRWQVTPKLSLDVTAYYNDLDHLVTGQIDFASGQVVNDPLPHLEVPSSANNSASGESYGSEISVTYQPAPEWSLTGYYTYCRITSVDPFAINEPGMQPEHMASLRFSWNPVADLDLDIWGRYVDDRPSVGVPSYGTMDVRIGYRFGKNWEVAAVGRNLVESRHYESGIPWFFQSVAMPVRRSFYGQISCRF